MSLLVKEYKIPFLGKVELLEGNGYAQSFMGKYYADSKVLRTGFVENCDSIEELQNKVLKKIQGYFSQQKEISEIRISSEKEKLSELENNLLDLGEEIKNDSVEWFEVYQTKNPLQKEYQEAERKKRNLENF